MAERVARVKVQATADLKGFDEANKALRELQKAVGPADAEISKVRQEILNFAQANKQSEAVINAQINALKQLRQQATLGGDVYKALGTDVDKLKRSLGEAGTAFQGTARSISDIGKATQSTQAYINNQAKSFEAMRKQAVDTIKTLENLGRQSDQLKTKGGVGNLLQGTRPGGGMFEVGRKGLADVQGMIALMKRLSDQAQTATGKVARISEGLFAAGAAGVAVNKATAAIGGVSSALEAATKFSAQLTGGVANLGAQTPTALGPFKSALNQIALLLNAPSNGLANWGESLNQLQAKLSMLNAPLDAVAQGIGALGPEGALVAGALALAFAKGTDDVAKEFKRLEKEAADSFQGITDEAQRTLRKLAELSQAFRGAASMNELQALRAGAQGRFNETPAGTDASRRAANTIANAEARIRAEGMAQADVLEAARQRYRGSAQDVTSLSERLAYLNQAMKLVDQTTSEGSIEYARFASEADQLKQKIDKLSNSYRTVAQAAADAAKQQGVYANQSTVANYFNRAGVKRSEEIAAAVAAAFAKPQTLALPAAGQTSFTGQYREGGLGGMARANLSNVEIAGTREKIGAPMGSQSQAAELKAMASAANQAETELTRLHRAMQAFAQSQIDKKVQQLSASLMLTGEQSHQAARAYDSLATQIEKVGRSSDTSLNSLRQQRQLWEQLYNSVEKTDPAFKKAAQNIQQLDKQIEKRDLGGMRGKVGYIGQGIGAAASAGIFGGPEGLVGGVGGALIGGVLGGPAGFATGAFIGSSVGTYASMLRQTIGGAGEYAAEVKRLEIALRGVTESAGEFAQAQRVIRLAGAELNVPVLEATKGFTQLTAAVKGAGGGVTESEAVFRGVTEAIKATGGGAEEVQGALTAMAQIFSKGKVSAEELQGQLGERLPGAVTLFAQATGRSLPQLQKDLQDGVVGLNDVMKFAVALTDKYGAQAATMAGSTEDATARMKVALDDLRLAFGSIVKPITASIQSVITRMAEMAVRALKAVGVVRDGLSELGSAGRAKDLQTRGSDALRALGSGVQSENEKRAALRLTSDLLKGVTPQQSLVGVQQNIRALEQARNIVRQINAEGLNEKQIQVVQNYGALIDKRIVSERKLLETLKEQRKFKDFGSSEKTDKDTEKERKAAEKLASEQQQLNEATAKAEIELQNTVHRNAIELIRKQFEYRRELQDAELSNWVDSFTGAGESLASTIAAYFKQIDDLRARSFDSNLVVKNAEQQFKSAQKFASVTGGTVAGGDSGGLAFSTFQLNSAAREASKFTGIANMCAESVKAFYKSLGISLPGVTAWADTVRKAGKVMTDWSQLRPGDIVATGRPGDTPHVGVYTGGNNVFHQSRSRGLTVGNYPDLNYFKSGYFVRPDVAAVGSGGALQRRSVDAAGELSEARVNLQNANQLAGLDKAQVEALEKLINSGLSQKVTESYREQTNAIANQQEALALRNQLQMEGARQEVIDGELKKLDLTQQSRKEQEVLNQALEVAKTRYGESSAQVDEVRNSIDAQKTSFEGLKQKIDEATAAQIRFNDAMRFRQDTNIGAGFKEGVQQYVEGIGTMRQAMSQLAVTGIKGVEDSLLSLVTTGTANFREFAASILKDTARMIIQQLVLRTVMQAIGFLNPASAAAATSPTAPGGDVWGAVGRLLGNANGNAFGQQGVIPFAAGGIVDRPTYFKFAKGGVPQLGLMGEAGPEAIMPLRRGRDGRLGVAASGGHDRQPITVNVSVDAQGTQVQGNAGQGDALGRAVAQAVQAELIKQKRPGGLLAA